MKDYRITGFEPDGGDQTPDDGAGPRPAAGSGERRPNGHTDSGATATDILTLPLTPAAWAARDLPPPDFLMGERFSTTSRELFSADTGLGKSMFALGLAIAMRLGRDFLHWKCRRPARVLILDGEMPADLLQDRIRLACGWFGVGPDEITDGLYILSREDVEDMPPLDSEEGAAWLLELLDRLPVDFVIFDNCMCLTVGDLREETTWRALVPLYRDLSRRKVGQLWLHHVGHDKTRAYGSRLFSWGMDVVSVGEAIDDPSADVAFKQTAQKSRRRTPDNRADFEAMEFRLQDETWTAVPAAGTGTNGKCPALTDAAKNALKALEKALAANGTRPPDHEQTRGVHSAVGFETWRRYFRQISAYGDDQPEARKKSFQRGTERLLAAGLVVAWGDHFWIRTRDTDR